MKRSILILSLVLLCLSIGKGLYRVQKGFSPRRIAAPARMQLEIWDEEADLAIREPFRFLGRGRQCFAFESQGGRYVLKFPRTDIYQTPFWARAFPFLDKEREAHRYDREAREAFVLNSMKIAYEELKSDTGIVALHFGETTPSEKTLTFIDALGFPYRLPVHKATFIIQTKHPILIKTFLERLHSGDREKAKEILDALIDVVVARGSKGIWNKDASFLRNYGFDGIKGFQIDIGSFYHKADGAASIRDTLHPIRTWLSQIDPDMLAYFDRSLEKRIQSISK